MGKHVWEHVEAEVDDSDYDPDFDAEDGDSSEFDMHVNVDNYDGSSVEASFSLSNEDGDVWVDINDTDVYLKPLDDLW